MQPRGLGRRNMFKVFQLFASLVLLWCLSGLALTQDKPSAEDQAKLDQAQKEAARFVERFRRTLDFATVWREFHSSDTTCAIRTNPSLPGFTGGELTEKSFGDRLKEMKLDDRLLERLHIAYWNSALLYQTYIFTVSPSKNGSEPEFESQFVAKHAPGIRRILAFLRKIEKSDEESGPGKHDPRSVRDFNKVIANSNRFAALLRRYMPRNALRSANWKSAVLWWEQVHGVRKVANRERLSDWCPAGSGPVYVSQIGFFVFHFVEEKGKFKLWSMGYVDN